MKEELTGRYYHKKTCLGLVLYVEVQSFYYDPFMQMFMEGSKSFRKATQEDLLTLKFEK